MARVLAALLLLSAVSFAQNANTQLNQLATDFWAWRAKYRPFTGDDVPRMEHAGGTRNWSAASIEKQRADLDQFERRWSDMRASSWPVAQQVDYRLMGSAIARVRWELDVNPRWQRDPTFYIEQTVTSLVESLLAPPPFDKARSEEIVARSENIPSILSDARINLKPIGPFARLAIESLADIDTRMSRAEAAVEPLLSTQDERTRFRTAMGDATKALIEYREWLKQGLPVMRSDFALGPKAYGFFLHKVALLPYTPDQLLTMARQDFERVLAFEAYEKQRDLQAPPLRMATNTDEMIARMMRDDKHIRSYLVAHQVLSVPGDLPHWTLRAMPDYLSAFEGFGEIDDFGSLSRVNDNGIRWITPPSAHMPYFFKAYALDARTTGVHEGVPGHFFQLSLARRNPDPIRRQYYDSVANEGIGFYAEEMMLQVGLYDDSPRTREIIYNFARLRALRVEADVKLALGEFTIEQAADYLEETVPMDHETAQGEAASFATAPGLAIDYEIGKLQIERMLADRRLQLADKFMLRDFHDYVWSNGNVPFALQRWELLGLSDDIKKVDSFSN